jgi:hypothetical protein
MDGVGIKRLKKQSTGAHNDVPAHYSLDTNPPGGVQRHSIRRQGGITSGAILDLFRGGNLIQSFSYCQRKIGRPFLVQPSTSSRNVDSVVLEQFRSLGLIVYPRATFMKDYVCCSDSQFSGRLCCMQTKRVLRMSSTLSNLLRFSP